MNKVVVGIIGYGPGSASQTFHVPLVSYEPRLRLKAVSSLMADEIRGELPGITVVGDAEEIINDPEIDLIVVATPNAWHFEYAKLALEAGKHVVVEKPLAISSKQADELIDLAQAKERIVMQFHNRRWDGGFLTVKKLLAEGRFGEVAFYEANYDRWVPSVPAGWREQDKPGAGALYDLGIHLIDQAIALFGLPKAVTATVRRQRPNAQTDDYFLLQLDYGTMQAVLRASMLAALPGPRYRVSGAMGTFEKHFASYGADPQAGMLIAGMRPSDKAWGKDEPADYGIFSDGETRQPVPTVPGSYQLFYGSLAAAIIDKTPASVPPEDARNTIAVVEAAMRSNETGRRVMAEEIGFRI